jgi:hypothetical protein
LAAVVKLEMSDEAYQLAGMIHRYLKSACPDEVVTDLACIHDYASLNVTGRLGRFYVMVSEYDDDEELTT